jgi:hypothetical protein
LAQVGRVLNFFPPEKNCNQIYIQLQALLNLTLNNVHI